MAKVLVLYKTPTDPAAFDKYYATIHIPLAKQIPGLKRYDVSTGAVRTPTGPSGVHLPAELNFDSFDALAAGMAPPQRQPPPPDLPNFPPARAAPPLYHT